MGFALLAVVALLLLGAVWVALLDRFTVAALSGARTQGEWRQPLYRAAALLTPQQNRTEAPDLLNWRLAPALYLALSAAGLALVPFTAGTVLVATPAGIVLWGAVEALTVVVVFLHGWSANAPLALMGAYRYVAIGLPIMLLSMFVLIAATLPAESLAVTAIVASQETVWNVVRQPLGLPLFLLLGLSLTFRGPFNYADSADLAGGTASESSGAAHALWQLARLTMLVSFAGMASTVFLGGYLGPVLPGPIWLGLKTALLLVLLVGGSHLFARLPPSRMLTFLWTVLLPLAFVDLVAAGLLAL